MPTGKRCEKIITVLKGYGKEEDMEQINEPVKRSYIGTCKSCEASFRAYEGELSTKFIPIGMNGYETICRIEKQAVCPICTAIVVFEKESI